MSLASTSDDGEMGKTDDALEEAAAAFLEEDDAEFLEVLGADALEEAAAAFLEEDDGDAFAETDACVLGAAAAGGVPDDLDTLDAASTATPTEIPREMRSVKNEYLPML